MKILIVDQMAGGFGQLALYKAIAASGGMNITVLVPGRSFDGFSTVRAQGERGESWRVVTARSIFPNRSHRSVVLKLWTLLRKEKFDLVYVEAEPESYQAVHAVVGRGLLQPRAKVVLMSYRNFDFPPGKYPFRASWTHASSERVTVPRIDGMVAHNSDAARIFQARGVPEVVTIAPSVDIGRFRQAASSALGKRGPRFTIGYVGRFVPEKGIDVLLKASARLGFDHQVLLVGRGPAEDSLRRLCGELKIAERVRWVGPVPYELLPNYYVAMDILVLPSRTTPFWKEQFGRVLIESMACGVPSVGADSGGIRETIADAGMTFKEGDAGDLAAKLTGLYEDPQLCRHLREKGRERACSEFSVEKVAALYRPFFERVCASELRGSRQRQWDPSGQRVGGVNRG